jgi:protein-tyrosine phosphatase
MNWIDDFVAVSGWEDALSIDDLKEADIDLIIDARTLFDGVSGINMMPIVDKVMKVGDMLVALTKFNAKVLVHCFVGIDRTPFVAMVYVGKKYDMSYKDAYEFVKKKNPHTVFHWDWVEMLGTREEASPRPKR